MTALMGESHSKVFKVSGGRRGHDVPRDVNDAEGYPTGHGWSGLLRGMAADPSLRDIPVVIISSLPEATVAERRAGYTAFMRKPFKITDVVSLTERLIGAP